MNDAHQSGATITLNAKQVQSIFDALMATGNTAFALKVMSLLAPQQQPPARIIPPTPAPIHHLPEPTRRPTPDQQDVIDALRSLGYRINEIKPALEYVDPTLTLEERIRLTLQHLVPSRGQS